MQSSWAAGATAPSSDPIVHVLQRFTYGPTKELVSEVNKIGADAWFEKQLDHLSISDRDLESYIAKQDCFNYIHKDMNFLWPLAESEGDITKGQIFNSNHFSGRVLRLYTLIQQAHSNRQIFEMMVEFWHDHFNITTIGDDTKDGRLDWHTNDWNKRVIREYALTKFEDLLQATALHPAMIIYLDGELSTKELPNENYGRELLELHTVTPKSGYTQADILEASKLFSGLRVNWPERWYQRGPRPMPQGKRRLDISPFATMLHEERQNFGTFKIMGWQRTVTSADQVMPAIKSLLNYLAMHPETAKTIALKLGRRFVEDVPSQKFISDISSTYISSGGDIKETLRAVYKHSDFKNAIGTKLKRPGEDYISVARALDVWPDFTRLQRWPAITKEFAFPTIIPDEVGRMGHAPLSWPFPDGYPDIAVNWVNANYQVLRWNVYGNFVQGNIWKAPVWDSLLSVRETNLDRQIDQVSQLLLFKELGSADRISVRKAVVKVFGENPNFTNQYNDITGLIARLIFQLPVWSLR
ncbi:MAG: DUF1800 domain-containing protein [Candidatus Nanopelagicaceae bacterium]|nr:DUF1800 domain-containing protein [Candidatus Nanopelagicaceae bacterium]